MIVYLDASALVKRYVTESGSATVNAFLADAAALGTSVITRAEVGAALGKAARMRVVFETDAAAALEAFAEDWVDLTRLRLNETTVARAASLAWDHGLRGYDAVHLATALLWRELLDTSVTLATFDRRLWNAAAGSGFVTWPDTI
jgi:uncharacterized protein